MSNERELLERLLENFERPVTGRLGDLFDEVRELLSTPKPTQDELLDFCDTHCTWRDHHPDCPLKAKYGLSKPEPVDISDTLKPTNVAMLPNGVSVSNVYEAYAAGLKEGSLPDEEPIENYDIIDAMRSACPYYSNELKGAFYDGWMQREKLHPAPRPEFVRLSEEEVSEILSSAYTPYELLCAVENRLVEKNK